MINNEPFTPPNASQREVASSDWGGEQTDFATDDVLSEKEFVAMTTRHGGFQTNSTTPSHTLAPRSKLTSQFGTSAATVMNEENSILYPLLAQIWYDNIPLYAAALFLIICLAIAGHYDEYIDVEKSIEKDGRPNSLLHQLTDDQIQIVFMLVYTLICVSTGLMAEIFFGMRVLNFVNNTGQLWVWFYCELAFAFLILVGFGTSDMAGLPFGIAGLYKCGFPETTGYFQSFRERWAQRDIVWVQSLLTGMGLLLQTSCEVFAMVALETGYAKQTTPMFITVLPTILHHFVITCKFFHANVYLFIAFMFEVWWEYEMYYNIAYLEPHSIRYMARLLVFSHWIGITATVFLFLCPSKSYTNDEIESHITQKGHLAGDIDMHDFHNPYFMTGIRSYQVRRESILVASPDLPRDLDSIPRPRLSVWSKRSSTTLTRRMTAQSVSTNF